MAIPQKPLGPLSDFQLDIPPTWPRPWPDPFYVDLAKKYNQLLGGTHKPVQIIADANGIDVLRVNKWIRTARTRGFLEKPNFISGKVQRRIDPVGEFYQSIKIVYDETSCWEWVGRLDPHGYGQFHLDGTHRAHRLFYEWAGLIIGDGLHLDHLCHNQDESCLGGKECRHRRCVRPSHLEPVTREENIKRGKVGRWEAIKTHCKRGHPYDEQNTYTAKNGSRICRTCTATQARERRESRRHGEKS